MSSRRVDCGSWLASVAEDVAAARELRRAIQGLDPEKPREAQSLVRALAVLNSVYSENADLVEPDVARSFIDAELGLVQETLEPGGSQHASSLRRIAGHLDRVGELGRALDIMIERHRALEAALGTPGAKSSALAMSAEELGKRADYVRRVDGLPDATYVSAREAVAIALEHEPSEESLLMAQVVLSARVSDFKSIFAHIQELKSSSQITGDHPLFLAMQAIAFNASPPTQPVSKMRLKAAIELARQPEYVDVPGLQETVRWAERFINGTE